MPRNCKPEALVEREVLLAVGRMPGLLISKNEVGNGHPVAIRAAMAAALKPFGPTVVATALSVLRANMMRWGLGVGSPDLVFSYHGLAGGIELKAEDGRLSEDQERWHRAATARGFPVGVAHSPEEAIAFLDDVKKRGGGA